LRYKQERKEENLVASVNLLSHACHSYVLKIVSFLSNNRTYNDFHSVTHKGTKRTSKLRVLFSCILGSDKIRKSHLFDGHAVWRTLPMIKEKICTWILINLKLISFLYFCWLVALMINKLPFATYWFYIENKIQQFWWRQKRIELAAIRLYKFNYCYEIA
jgi:hypothetical protein